MEQKLMEKLDRARKVIQEQIDEHNSNVRRFMSEFWTEDVVKLVKVIEDYQSTPYSYYSKNYEHRYKRSGDFGVIDNVSIDCNCCLSDDFNYNDTTIRNTTWTAERIAECKRAFENFQLIAEDIMKDITSRYKKITENQLELLDKAFALLNVEEKPTKHIKVTVEWI